MSELLKVLDMTEAEILAYLWERGLQADIRRSRRVVGNTQATYLTDDYSNEGEFYYAWSTPKEIVAFRLRDEATMPELAVACEQVFHAAKKFHGKPDVSATPKTWMWFVCCARPIHWIIAALIAKEKK